jgi:hypothetical protein
MKRIIVLICSTGLFLPVFSQQKSAAPKKPATTASKPAVAKSPATAAPVLKSTLDSMLCDRYAGREFF